MISRMLTYAPDVIAISENSAMVTFLIKIHLPKPSSSGYLTTVSSTAGTKRPVVFDFERNEIEISKKNLVFWIKMRCFDIKWGILNRIQVIHLKQSKNASKMFKNNSKSPKLVKKTAPTNPMNASNFGTAAAVAPKIKTTPARNRYCAKLCLSFGILTAILRHKMSIGTKNWRPNEHKMTKLIKSCANSSMLEKEECLWF